MTEPLKSSFTRKENEQEANNCHIYDMSDVVSDNKAILEGNLFTMTFLHVGVNRPYEFILPEHIASTT